MTETIIPHHEEQPSHAELREQFRVEHLADLKSQMQSHHELGWGVIGDPEKSRAKHTPETWAYEMHKRMEEKAEFQFEVPEKFGLILEEQAKKAADHDSVFWLDDVDGTADLDAPPVELASLSDDEICDYVADSIERTKQNGKV